MTTFSISLNSKTDVFFPNSEVSGALQLMTNEPNKITQIWIEIVGCARTYFEEIIDYGNGVTSVIPYSKEQLYMDYKIILWQNNNSNLNSTTSLSIGGLNQFPFKFVIPSDAAPNISEKMGEIQYYIKAIVEFRPKLFGKKNEIGYYGFSVCPFIDLNLDPNLKLSAYTTVTQIRRTFLSCAKKSLMVTMTLPKTGYVCGEIIPLQIDISNKTSMKIRSIDFGISIKGFFTATYGPVLFECNTETKTKDVSLNVVTNSVKPTSNSATYSFTIPPLSPSYSECEFLRIEYYVFVKVHTNACFKGGPTTCIPITIGTIPMMKSKDFGASKILETADFIEGVTRCKIRESYCNEKKDGPKEFRPKYAYYSNLPSTEKLSSE